MNKSAVVSMVAIAALSVALYGWSAHSEPLSAAVGLEQTAGVDAPAHARRARQHGRLLAPSEVPQRRWQVGVTRHYVFRAKRELSLDAGQKRTVRLSTEAAVDFTPLEGAGEELVSVLVHMQGVETATQGSRNSRLTLDLDAVATYHRDGRLEDLRFTQETPVDKRRAVAAVVAALQWAAPASPRAQAWEARESHTTGEYLAEYKRQSEQPDADLLHIHKAKSRYLALFSSHGVRPVRGSGESAVTSDEQFAIAQHGWARHARIHETTVVQAKALWIEMRSEMEATLEGSNADGRALSRGALLASQPLQNGLHGLRNAAEKRRAHDQQLTRGQDTSALLAAIAATGPEDREERLHLITRLGAALRLDPTTTDEVVRMARGSSEDHAHVAIAALGAATTPAAQHAITELIGDAQLDMARRVSATTAVHSLTEPTEETKQALAQARSSDDPDLHSVAVLASGTVAHKTQDSGIVQELLTQLDGADSDAERVLAIEALGNAGDSSALPALTQAVRQGGAAARRAAVGAARFLEGPEAESIVVVGLADASASVRQEALQSLQYRDWTHMVDALGATVARDEDEDVRLSLVRLLGDNPEAGEGLLRELAAQDGSAQVRAAAVSVLTEAS